MARRHGLFGKTATLGRQHVHVPNHELDKALGGRGGHEGAYCEALLIDFFGADDVVSIDSSDYEGATQIHDLNHPLPEGLVGKFDTVIDAGTLEHVYDIAQALKNTSMLVKPGGQIIHISPSNNFCGHGFWQFSPGLFFSLYSPKNGYRNTEVFVAELGLPDVWFKVREPQGTQRIEIIPQSPMFVIVRTVVDSRNFSHDDVNQSDYLFAWEGGLTSLPQRTPVSAERMSPSLSLLKSYAKSKIMDSDLIRQAYGAYRYRDKRLSNRNPHLTMERVKDIIAGTN
jgi:SAM-dependent methyltransferase